MNESEYAVQVDQLQPGVYIRLDKKWFEHPFLKNAFKITKAAQIQQLKEYGIDEVICVPERSDRPPLTRAMADYDQTPAPEDGDEQASTGQDGAEQWALKRQRMQELQKAKRQIEECARKYRETVHKAGNLMSSLFAGDKQGIAEAETMIKDMVDVFLQDSQAVMHLMDASDREAELTYHFLNVSVLALMIGEAAGLGSEQMRLLGLGAFVHDLGKMRLEKKHWNKPPSAMSKSERELVRRHPRYGAEVLKKNNLLPQTVVDIVQHHHERLNGFGFPDRLKGDQLSGLTKIVSLANVFDNLCNRPDPEKSLPPHQALLLMYTRCDTIIDMHLFSLFVERLSIYPPGSVVELSSGDIGLVMAVNPESPLQPMLMLYDPEVPKKQAVIFNMLDEPDLFITGCRHPLKLSPEVQKYLRPSTRLSYFMDQKRE